MTFPIRTPRLLPVTIAVLGVVLVSKSAVLIRAAIENGQPAAFISAAWAGGPEAPVKPAVKPPLKPGDFGQTIKPSGGPDAPNASETPAAPNGAPPMTGGEKSVLLELRARRRELDAREATLASRESMLAAAEKKLSERVGQLQSLQARLESLDASHRAQENTAWQGLVKVYEDMKPRDAAVIFNDLGMPVLLAVIDRMKEAKAAAVLAAMLPEKARDVTMQLALARTKAATALATGGKASPGSAPGKPAGSGT